MYRFKTFITEEEKKQVVHITHLEDRPLQRGSQGTEHALGALKAAHTHITTGMHSSQLTTKYDGSPAIVYGHHPTTGKFFVASKSAFNKTPKINYSEQDIQNNHGHAPGLVAKLTHALHHLKKIAPKKGVYQGDMMFSHEDVKHNQKTGSASFNPNPSGLTYTAQGREAEKVRKAKIGVVTHLTYHGEDPTNLSAHHGVDHQNFKQHSDVYTIDPRYDASKVKMSDKDNAEFQKNLEAAKKAHKEGGAEMYAATQRHGGDGGHLMTYINQTVRTGVKPDHKGFKSFLEKQYNNAIDKVKTEKSKKQKADELTDHLQHIDANKQHYNNLFKLHHHLQKAKNALVNTLNQHQDFQHTHGQDQADPEGYVFHHNGETDKLIHRHVFSRRNLTGIRNI